MKKLVCLVLLCVCSASVFAQLKVTSDGKVGVGITQTPISKFAVGTPGYANMRNVFESDIVTMYVNSLGNSPYDIGSWGTAIQTSTLISSSRGDLGIYGIVQNATPLSRGRAAGIVGRAGNATSGYNWGIIGSLGGSNNGTGILGTIGDYPLDVSINGRYAGYFNGNVRVTGTINGVVVGNSDIRYKQNVEEISTANSSGKQQVSVLNTITSLQPISYNYKQVYMEPQGDTLRSVKSGLFDEKSLMYKKKHFGLVAQDLQKVYPDLVYEEDNGYLAINYIELIPLLIQSIKELKAEVDQLTSGAIRLQSATSSDDISGISHAVLYQNIPNPFTDRTEIKFTLPDQATHASICIFNMQGTMLKQIQVSSQQPSVTINGSELSAGMYLYSLIVDGQLVDTKRMILTR